MKNMTNKEWLLSYYPEMIDTILADVVHLDNDGEPVWELDPSEFVDNIGTPINKTWLYQEHGYDPLWPIGTPIEFKNGRILFYAGRDKAGRNIGVEYRGHIDHIINNEKFVIDHLSESGSLYYFPENEVLTVYEPTAEEK